MPKEALFKGVMRYEKNALLPNNFALYGGCRLELGLRSPDHH